MLLRKLKRNIKRRKTLNSFLLRGILIFYFFFFTMTSLVQGNIIHVIGENDFAFQIEKKYQNYLDGKSLIEVNPQVKDIVYEEKKELIVSSRVNISFCSHVVKKGDWFVKIIRKYSYKSPYSLGLTSFAIEKNSHIENPNLIIGGDRLSIPILVFGMKSKNLKEEKSCTVLFKDHKKSPFIVRSRNAYSERREEKIIFHPGTLVKGLQRNLVKGKSGFIERAFKKNLFLWKSKRGGSSSEFGHVVKKSQVRRSAFESKRLDKKSQVRRSAFESKRLDKKSQVRRSASKSKRLGKKSQVRRSAFESKRLDKKSQVRRSAFESKRLGKKSQVRRSAFESKRLDKKSQVRRSAFESKRLGKKSQVRRSAFESKRLDKKSQVRRSAF